MLRSASWASAAAQAAITEFVTSWLEGAALGAAGGAALGAMTESAEAFVLFFQGDLIIGSLAGEMRNEVKARFSANRVYRRG